jgi:hypothetical protein
MASPTSADPQFQLAARYPANLDRCRRCGNPRQLHGADGSCGLAVPGRSDRAARLAVAAALVAALGGATWLLVSTTTASVSSAAAFGALVSLILLAGLAAFAGRRR